MIVSARKCGFRDYGLLVAGLTAAATWLALWLEVRVQKGGPGGGAEKREQGRQVALPSRCRQPLVHPCMPLYSDISKPSVVAHFFYIPHLTSLTLREPHTSHSELHPWFCHRCPLPHRSHPQPSPWNQGSTRSYGSGQLAPILCRRRRTPSRQQYRWYRSLWSQG